MRDPRLPAEGFTTAVLMAAAAGVDRKAFRRQLRAASLSWHTLKEPWTVPIGSPEHRDMQHILKTLR